MSNANQNTSDFNMDSLLDGTLDDLADMPEFKPFPAGTHRVTVHFEQKVVNNFPGFEIKLKALETVELPAGSTAEPVAKGAETSVFYFFKHTNPITAELGQGKFKEVMKSLATHFGPHTNRELLESAQGAEVIVVTDQRKGKQVGQIFTDLVALQVV
jgi:hypothetical protein